MTILRCESVIRPLNEGKYHNGTSAVVQFVAMRPCSAEPHLRVYGTQLKDYLRQGTYEEKPSLSIPEDKLLAVSSRLNGLTVDAGKRSDLDRCECCWSPRRSCFCNAMKASAALSLPLLRFTVLCHPLEFMRSTSSGKLVSMLLGGDFILYSASARLHGRLRTVLQDPGTVLLYPTNDSLVTGDLEAPSSIHPRHAVVLDGTWAQTKALLQVCLKMNPNLRTVKLGPYVKEHFSPLVDAVHPGFGHKRITTFEASWMFLQETLQEVGARQNLIRYGRNILDERYCAWFAGHLATDAIIYDMPSTACEARYSLTMYLLSAVSRWTRR